MAFNWNHPLLQTPSRICQQHSPFTNDSGQNLVSCQWFLVYSDTGTLTQLQAGQILKLNLEIPFLSLYNIKKAVC